MKMKKGNHFDTLLIIVGLFSFLFIFGLLTTISQKPFFAQVVEDDIVNDSYALSSIIAIPHQVILSKDKYDSSSSSEEDAFDWEYQSEEEEEKV